MSVAYYQGKWLKKKEKFIQMVGKLKIHRSTLIFRINVDWEVSEINEVISDAYFFEKLF